MQSRKFRRPFAAYFAAYPNKLRQHIPQQTSSTKLRQTNSSNNLSATKIHQPDFSDPKIFIQEVILTPGYLVTKNQWINCCLRKFHCNFILQECWPNINCFDRKTNSSWKLFFDSFAAVTGNGCRRWSFGYTVDTFGYKDFYRGCLRINNSRQSPKMLSPAAQVHWADLCF